MIKIAICDDEKKVLEKLKKITSYYFNNCNYYFSIDCFTTPKELLENIEAYSIILLDINIGNYNGIEVAKQIRRTNRNAKIIFVTNHPEFIKQSLLVRAFGYIEKPIQKNEIYHTLQEAIEYLNSNSNSVIKEFKTTSGTMYIDLNSIIAFKYHNRIIEIITFEKSYIMYDTIKNLSSTLKQFQFYSPHNAYLVNLKYIVAIYGNIVELKNNLEVPISERKAKKFKTTIANEIAKNEIERLKV